MATDLSRDQLRRLARLGAHKRLEELRQEEAAIRAAFPDLDEPAVARGGRGRRAAGAKGAGGATRAKAAKRARRTPMSAAQKKAVSERMKKYWATRRKASE